MSPLLRVQQLCTTFTIDGTPARAVDGVSFELEAGETLGLVGESGCGKTVTALSILRLIETPPGEISPDSVIEYDGTDILKLPPKELRRIRGAEIAMVFQEPTTSLNPVLTVGTQIAETVRAHRPVSRDEARHRAVELLDLVRIPDADRRVHQYPHELSGGMQQRVMIAMALSCEPKVLIADEPTTALDVTIQAQILELLADLQRQLGMAMMIITHDLGVVAGVADRVAIMYAGQIVEQATTASVFAQPPHPYTEALLRAAPRIDAPTDRLPVIPGAVPPASSWPVGCRFHPRCRHQWEHCTGAMPDLLQQAPQHRVRCWLVTEPHRRKE
jgi:oligopeptide/dipeptide ABC transporter ATP-binding protein